MVVEQGPKFLFCMPNRTILSYRASCRLAAGALDSVKDYY
jgi:hypothetical protein